MIVNVTQHVATPEQKAQGVHDLPGEVRKELSQLLTFEELPTRESLLTRATQVAQLISPFEGDSVMIGGAPFFMPLLELVLQQEGWKVVYAFSRREAVEDIQPDGSVRKTAMFRHVGFVEA